MEDKLPASIAAAWGRQAPRGRGPKPGLSLERIVGAGVRVAATEGLGAVSMSRVAAELGASTMALYRYVNAKDELLALMVDAAFGPPPGAADEPGRRAIDAASGPPGEMDEPGRRAIDAAPGAAGEPGWRAGLARWAWGHHAVLRRHPWIVRIPIGAPPITPNLTAWMEDGLRALGQTQLAEEDKLSVMLLLSGFVRNEATVAADISATAQPEIMVPWGALLAELTDDARFPALRAALASTAFSQDDDPDDEFAFGLERILDGIGVLVEKPRPRR
jgi:AcrR family transcriptional regulator